ncbi:LuxR C-terminal-related transcriptional regulator [Nonomuraea sp. NPDC050643]|uniref:response regulator transcription factor n=1 Tax=Nonomuraea sp. NPDC050643 TaxID=3155660 RepID=UPI003401EE17
MGAAGIQVAVCSANRLLREAVGTILAQRPAVCLAGLTHDVGDLIRLCGLRPVDVALIDVHGDFAAVIEGVRALRTTRPDRGIVLTYSALTAGDVIIAVGAGVTGLIPYSRGVSAVMEAVEEGPRPPAAHPTSLTDRDLEILRLVGGGYNVKEIAAMLDIAPSTVESHKRRIYAKLNGRSSPEVVSQAARLGLLRAEPHISAGNLVIVFGPGGPRRDLVVKSLIRQAVPVLVAGERWADDDEVLQIRRPVVAVLVDHSGVWEGVRALGARVVIVTESLSGRALGTVGSLCVPETVIVHELPGGLGQALAMAARCDADPPAPPRSPSVRSALTCRELEILDSIARGHSVRQTGEVLGISIKTVENIQARLFAKLAVRNRAESLAVAYELGLMPGERIAD